MFTTTSLSVFRHAAFRGMQLQTKRYLPQQQLFSGTTTCQHNISRLHFSTFRPTQHVKDWRQHVDHKNGGFYYEDIFTGKITREQPKMFIPHDHVEESGTMSMLRNDGLSPTKGRMTRSQMKRNLFKVVFIAGTLYVLDATGTLQKLMGFEQIQPSKIDMDERVVNGTKDKVKSFADFSLATTGKPPV